MLPDLDTDAVFSVQEVLNLLRGKGDFATEVTFVGIARELQAEKQALADTDSNAASTI